MAVLMKRLAWLLMLLPSLAMGADVYIDQGCTFNGTGAASNCPASGGASGALNAIPSLADNNTYHWRGVHAAHTDCAGFDGRYFADRILLNGVDNTIIQSYGWTAPGTGEHVYYDNTAAPGTAWAQCVWDGAACDCDAAHLNVTIGSGVDAEVACGETWWTPAGDATSANWKPYAQKPDGSPTFRVASLAAMTNATSGYHADRCSNSVSSTQTFIPCFDDTDCPSGETCSATSNEVDSFWDTSDSANRVLFVRFGTDANCSDQRCDPTNYRSYINTSANSYGFESQAASPATNITIRGIFFRTGRRAAVIMSSGTTGFTIDDVWIVWRSDHTGGGSDYGIASYNGGGHTFKRSYFVAMGSEAIHTEGLDSDVATVLTIQDNVIRDVGDLNMRGPGGTGTPECFTIGGADVGDANYSGTVISNNLCLRSQKQGLQLENDANNAVVRDNIFWDIGFSCIRINCLSDTSSSDGNEILNNICYFPGQVSQTAGFTLRSENPTGTCSVSSNLFYNNTIVLDPTKTLTEGIQWETSGAGTHVAASNIFRNNIISAGGSVKLVDWTNTTASNLLEYNLFDTTAATAITWLNTGRACDDVDLAGTGNVDPAGTDCPSAGFTSASDFHITTSSLAKDAGTAVTLVIGTRDTDINNTLAVEHGLTDYSDGNVQYGPAWDIGASEFYAPTFIPPWWRFFPLDPVLTPSPSSGGPTGPGRPKKPAGGN